MLGTMVGERQTDRPCGERLGIVYLVGSGKDIRLSSYGGREKARGQLACLSRKGERLGVSGVVSLRDWVPR